MIYALVKNNIVVNKIAIADGATLVPLADTRDASVHDVYDGVSFSKNPNEADLKALELKKREMISSIQKAQDQAALDSAIADLNAQSKK